MVSRKTDDKWEPIDSLATTGATVAKNIKRIRVDRGLAYTELAARLEVLEREIPTWGLRKIESGGRRVDADDLVALAMALGVSPAKLLMPPAAERSDPVDVTGIKGPVRAEALWAWLTADQPLREMQIGPGAFRDNSWPQWLLNEFESLMDDLRKQAVKNLGDDQ